MVKDIGLPEEDNEEKFVKDEEKETQQGEAEAHKLNARQELFCQFYASDREFFGNGTQSYIEAYNIDINVKGAYKVAKAAACRLLTNVYINQRIDNILEDGVLNNNFVDKQLALVITQKADLPAKMAGIREYNAMKGRIIKKKGLVGKDGELLDIKSIEVEFKDFSEDEKLNKKDKKKDKKDNKDKDEDSTK